jgi:hypothetical protein
MRRDQSDSAGIILLAVGSIDTGREEGASCRRLRV